MTAPPPNPSNRAPCLSGLPSAHASCLWMLLQSPRSEASPDAERPLAIRSHGCVLGPRQSTNSILQVAARCLESEE
jgi:hypothetical protein